ncbi:MAG: hypothetical protein E7267_00600 [Lachnospiraceae bacterium]|nr:hypothetical protein [Lachnospiraceae bacterium]
MNTENKKVKKTGSFSNRNFKQGMYNTIVVTFVVAIVILANLFVSQLGLIVDLTREEIYTLTDDTCKFAEEIKDNISLYYIVKEGEEYEVLQNVVEQYNQFDNIDVTWKDPELYPQFAAEYTDEEITGNDVIVVNNTTGASKFIPFSDLYIIDQSVNYSTMSTDYAYTLDAEGQITSALQFVTETAHTKMYVVSAHGEMELEEGVTELIQKANVTIEPLDMLSAAEIPEDCNVLLINGPTTDISEEELNLYKEYLDNGGGAIFTTAYTNEPLTNYEALLEYYGVGVTHSVVLEREGEHLPNYPTYIINNFGSVTSDVSSEFTLDDYMVMPIVQGLKVVDGDKLRSTITVSQIISTTEDSYGKTNAESENIEKEDGDISGPFDTVIQVTDTFKDKTGKIVIFASPYAFKDEWINYYNCANIEFLIDCIDWMKGKDSKSIAVPQRSLDQVYLEVDRGVATIWGIITIAIIPLTILGIGFVVWFRRRKH